MKACLSIKDKLNDKLIAIITSEDVSHEYEISDELRFQMQPNYSLKEALKRMPKKYSVHFADEPTTKTLFM